MLPTCPYCPKLGTFLHARCPACGRPNAHKSVGAARRRQYHCKRIAIPMMFQVLILVFVAGGAWYINNMVTAVEALSMPVTAADGGFPQAQVASEEGINFVPHDMGHPSFSTGPQFHLRETAETPSGSITVLVMGVDARPGEPIDIGVRPDALFVLHIDAEKNICRTLSIPRDTRVNLPGYGQSKINHALSVGGIPYQELVVEEFLVIEIDHFALIDFAGLVGVVDAAGGVTVYNEQAFVYADVAFPAGQLTLNGDEALLYARFRGDEEGDFGRQRRQQEIIHSLLDQADQMDGAGALPEVLQSIEGHFKSDVSVIGLIGLASQFRSTCTSASLESVSLDGSVGNDWDDLYDQELSFVHVDNEEINAKVSWLLGETATTQPTAIDIPRTARLLCAQTSPAGRSYASHFLTRARWRRAM